MTARTFLLASLLLFQLFLTSCKKEIDDMGVLEEEVLKRDIPSLKIINEADAVEWMLLGNGRLGAALSLKKEVLFSGTNYMPGIYFLTSDLDFKSVSVYPMGLLHFSELSLFYQSSDIIIFMAKEEDDCYLFRSDDEGLTWRQVASYNWKKEHKKPVGFSPSGDIIVLYTQEFVTRIYHLKDGIETRTNSFFGYDALGFENYYNDYSLLVRLADDSVNKVTKTYLDRFSPFSPYQGMPVFLTNFLVQDAIDFGAGMVLPNIGSGKYIYSNQYYNAWRIQSEFPLNKQACAVLFSNPYPMGWNGSFENLQIYTITFDQNTLNYLLHVSFDLGRHWNLQKVTSRMICSEYRFAQYKNETQILFTSSAVFISKYKGYPWVLIHTKK